MTLCILVGTWTFYPDPIGKLENVQHYSHSHPQNAKKDLRAGTIKANKDPSIVKPVHSGMFGRFEKVPAANM